MKPNPSPKNQKHDQEIIDLLKGLESHKVEYPPELLAARRADFTVRVKQARVDKTRQARFSNGQFTQRLKELNSIKADYPPELLAARRAAFIAQVEQHSAATVTEELPSKDQELIKLFNAIKTTEAEYQYPPKLMAARRLSFRRQIALGPGGVSLLETVRSWIQRLFLFRVKMPSLPMASLMRTSLIVAVLMVAAFATTLLRNREPLLSPAPTQEETFPPPVPTGTSTSEVTTVVCEAGEQSPLCPPEELAESQDLAAQGNGAARPAVAKDASSEDGVHKPSNVNDGREGAGWVSDSAYSWLKIDLGKVATINTVMLDNASLSSYNNRKLGQFVIAVALSDVYADGNSSNDYTEYTQVYDSEQTNFSGVVLGSESIRAMFGPVRARFVKITFKDAGAAVDEVKVFLAQPLSGVGNPPTRKPTDRPPASIATPIQIYNTALPANTATPVPTNTAVPPTRTPLPTLPPPTDIPPTDIPPTNVPPTPTDVPPTDIPPTDIPSTDIPPTDIPPVDTPNFLSPGDTSQP